MVRFFVGVVFVLGFSVTAGAGEIKVYYDFVEDGQLRGGVTFVEEPTTEKAKKPVSWPCVTLVDNGPAENRICLVIVGDGYTESDLGVYAEHADNFVSSFFGASPLGEYSSFFNVYCVEVVSSESGVDEPEKEIFKNTALDMAFDCGGTARLLCINTTKANEAARSAPKVDQVIALANSSRYGGAGYTNLATAAGGSSSAGELALHEFGHSFGRLDDEYHYGDGARYTGSEPSRPNVSIYDASAQLGGKLKWYRWLDLAEDDTFEGALYKQYGIYRPTANSRMRNLGRGFGPVNCEQFVINFYKNVSPVDDATPVSAGPLPEATTFYVVPVEPTSHRLDVRWLIDGAEVAGESGTTFAPRAEWLGKGVHEVTVEVVDNTPLVRDEKARADYMTWSRSWEIGVVSKFVVKGNIDRSGGVDYWDLVLMADSWLMEGSEASGDIWPGHSGDGVVDERDFGVLAADWGK